MGKKQKSKKKSKIDEKEFWVQKPTFRYKHPMIITIFKSLIMCLLIAGIIYVAICAKTIVSCDELKISKEDLIIKFENSTVYDIDGNYLATLSSGTKRKCISLSEMSEYLPKAYIAIEDERFYEHFGVDIKRTAAATISYAVHMGKSDFGGSTITQQVVKNITQDKEDSANRKVKEMAKALQVEKYLNKDQILELYLNIIFIGGNDINGVELGSKYYFNKTAKDLSIAECAFMAGINHAPNGYKPFNVDDNEMKEKIKTRTKTVLGKMLELNYINQEQYNQAIAEVDNGLNFQKGETDPTTVISYQTEAALDQIVDQIMVEKEVNKQMAEMMLYSGGYKIYTTQKTSIQNRVEEELSKPKYLIYNNGQASMATFVLMDHTTGYVLACGAGIGEDKIKTNIGNFNYPTKLKKQTGSSMKPLAVIAPGIENNVITASTVFFDGQTSFENGTYNPKNYYQGFRGPMTMREAIAISANIPHVKALAKIGVEKSKEFLKSVGITDLSDEGLALALGGLKNGTTAFNMTAAYASIAYSGTYVEPTFYVKVVDDDDNVLVESKSLDQRSTRVMSEQTAYIVKTILQSVVRPGGTATYCAIPGMDVAAKTGTTNKDYDRWLCGFTPYYTAACWFGYEHNAAVYYSGNPAGLIWSAIMRDIHEELPNAEFREPEGIITATVCQTTGQLATAGCGATYTEVFKEGTVPSVCSGHSYYTICNESGLLAGPTCTDVTPVSSPRALEQEQNSPWTTPGYGGNAGIPTETCTIDHSIPVEPEVTITEEPIVAPTPTPTPTPEPASQPETPAPSQLEVTPVPTQPEPTPTQPTTPTPTTPAPTPDTTDSGTTPAT